jgi:amino acid adenylation domain-containing protein
MTRKNALCDGFLASVAAYGSRPALEAGGEALTYAELFEKAASIAATLSRHEVGSEPPLTAVFAYRTVTAFAGVLGVLMRGHGYVPLNRRFPADRTRTMLQRSECRAMVVDAESEKQLAEVLEGIGYPLLIVLPERQGVEDLSARWPMHRFLGAGDLESHEQWRPVEVSPNDIAYLLFTSGSTGTPKGVMVAHRNVRPYIDFITERYGVTCEDRFAQTHEMTFDVSVSDMFVAWECGGCVCCPTEKMLINPGRFIIDSRLTQWHSVPSTAVFMKRLGALKAGTYPNLRVSLFSGEALPVEVTKAWAEAAPNSIIENVYGPTELTITCTYYRWDPVKTPAEAEIGVVPIGWPFPGMRPLVVDESLNEVKPGEDGEMLMTGPQLSLGYWRDPARTAAAFIKPPGKDEIYYRTGDRVRRPIGDGPMAYFGRVDNQIQVMGNRVELGEVEAVVREESGVDGVVALGWPKSPAGGADGIEVFLQCEAPAPSGLKERLAKRLPLYMIPRRYHCVPRFPLNSNGKFDRQALLAMLETKI